MQQYQISNIPSRFQLAQHFHSSLDQPNLDNVEAKLYAIRQRNYEMAQNFFKDKYGSATAYDQYLQESNMIDLKPVNAYEQTQLDLKKHLMYKARQIQKQEMEKIHSSKNVQARVVNKRPSSSAKPNPWLQNQKNKNSRLVQSNKKINSQIKVEQNDSRNYIDDQYGDYIQDQIQVIDLKKNKQNQKKGQFMSQFKQYLANKTKMKQSNKSNHLQQNQNFNSKSHIKRQLINNSVMTKSKMLQQSANNFMMNSSKMSMENSFRNNKSAVSLNPEQELVKKIFKNIQKRRPVTKSPAKSPRSSRSNRSSQHQYIQKVELAQYLAENPRILSVLSIGASQIIQRIQSSLDTKDPNKVRFHQCLCFVYNIMGKNQEQKVLKAKYCFEDLPEGCMLELEVFKYFEKTFKSLDKHSDLIVKRLDFIQKLALDPLLTRIINTPAVYEQNLQKEVSLRRIFQRIQVESLLNQGQYEKGKQYISWQQFTKYFESGHTNRGKYDILRLVESLKDQQKMGFTDIPQQAYQIICQAIKKLDKGQQYFSTMDVVGQIIANKLYEIEKYTFVRGKGNDPKSGNIPMETFEEVLARIKLTASKYLTVKEFLQFFSIKGEPTQIVQQKLQTKLKAMNDVAKVSKIQDQMFDSNDVEGYDSDPQFYNKSNVIDKKDFRKSHANDFTQLARVSTRFHQNNEANQVSLNKQNHKITVPKPFKFEQRERQREQKNKLNRSTSVIHTKSHTQFKFKAKQIPSKVKQIGLYQQIIEQNQKKIQDRRKCSMLMTLANEQPFSFYNRKVLKKTKQERKQFQFKANPIPWFCSVDLLQKKQEQQINRNQKIARMAQQSLIKAKLPPRMEKDFQQKMARKNMESAKKQRKNDHIIKAKQPPNFDVLHKQFEAAMQRKRKQNKTTEIKQFNFLNVKRQKKDKQGEQQFKQQQINNNLVEQKQQRWRQTLKSSINVFASSTAKFDQQVQKRRKQIQEKKRKQQQKQNAQQQRKKIDQQLKQKLKNQTSKCIVQKKQSLLIQNKRQQMKKQDQKFKEMKSEWLQNAKKQPLLIQRPLKRDQRLQKMKRLKQISQNLNKNGIKGKQHDSYFKRDQLLMLQDYQLLKKMDKI